MAGVKSAITKRINQTRNTPGVAEFQSRFHDHIIRNEDELCRIRQYIKNNPANWQIDKMRSDRKDARVCVPTGVAEIPAPYGEEPWML